MYNFVVPKRVHRDQMQAHLRTNAAYIRMRMNEPVQRELTGELFDRNTKYCIGCLEVVIPGDVYGCEHEESDESEKEQNESDDEPNSEQDEGLEALLRFRDEHAEDICNATTTEDKPAVIARHWEECKKCQPYKCTVKHLPSTANVCVLCWRKYKTCYACEFELDQFAGDPFTPALNDPRTDWAMGAGRSNSYFTISLPVVISASQREKYLELNCARLGKLQAIEGKWPYRQDSELCAVCRRHVFTDTPDDICHHCCGCSAAYCVPCVMQFGKFDADRGVFIINNKEYDGCPACDWPH
jgi:hypothetical protein